MKKIITVLILLTIFITTVSYGATRARGSKAPRVRNILPKDDSEVIIDQDGIDFKWGKVPIPPGGRRNFRFRLFKGFEYGSIENKKLKPDITSINIPSSMFEDDQIYVWEVSQRGSHDWSRPCRWSFKVKRKTNSKALDR